MAGPGGSTLGQCISEAPGKPPGKGFYCYVNSDSSCPDKAKSKRGEFFFSYTACEKCTTKFTPSGGDYTGHGGDYTGHGGDYPSDDYDKIYDEYEYYEYDYGRK